MADVQDKDRAGAESHSITGSHGLLFFLAAYAAALAILLPRLSLWLDEILTLIGARQPDFASLMSYLKTVPGGAPLAFLVPHWAIAVFGYSVFSARVMSAVFSVAACPAIFLLGRRLGLRAPLAAVLVFALCPLQFRYAMEARPYALAVCVSAWSTVLFLSMLEQPRSALRPVLYILLTAAGGFTLAYALFVPAAHLAWLVLTPQGRRAGRRVLASSMAAVTITAVALLPWYIHFRADWRGVNQEQQLGPWSWRPVLVFLKELTGIGYWGTGLMLIGVAWALWRAVPPARRGFWILNALAPMALVPAGDFAFGYFFAIRQMIYVLAPLALLFAAGAEALGKKGNLLLAVFLAASLYQDVQWFLRPREDWQAASSAAASALSQGGCVIFFPAGQDQMFTFFQPGLANRKCENTLDDRLVLAISPYNTNGAAPPVPPGHVKDSEQSFNGPRVAIYRRP